MNRVKILLGQLQPSQTSEMESISCLGKHAIQEASSEVDSADNVLFFVEPHARIGEIVLNRPQRMNAITKGMFAAIRNHLEQWEKDDRVHCILWRGNLLPGKGKAFSSGGELGQVVGDAGIHSFVGPEYALDHYISLYPKLQISIWNGIVMGAGYGLSAHSQLRIATEHIQFAMPESRFGLFADIGACYLLTHHCLPYLGRYLCTTADRIRKDDAVRSGLATHLVSESSLASLFSNLVSMFSEHFSSSNSQTKELETLNKLAIAAIPSDANHPTEVGALEQNYNLIKKHFSYPSLVEIYESLKNLPSENLSKQAADWVKFCLHAFNTDCCPTSNQVVFELIKQVEDQKLSYGQCLIRDYRLAIRLSLREDIVHGAISILQKTGRPLWNPATLHEVNLAEVRSWINDSLEVSPAAGAYKDLDIVA